MILLYYYCCLLYCLQVTFDTTDSTLLVLFAYHDNKMQGAGRLTDMVEVLLVLFLLLAVIQ